MQRLFITRRNSVRGRDGRKAELPGTGAGRKNRACHERQEKGGVSRRMCGLCLGVWVLPLSRWEFGGRDVTIELVSGPCWPVWRAGWARVGRRHSPRRRFEERR